MTRCLPLRLPPGADLRQALEQQARACFGGSAFVVAGIGSLSRLSIRLAAAEQDRRESGAFELLGLSGTVSPDGAHLHMSVAGESGEVVGGHVGYGNVIRTTAEVLLVAVEGWELSRELDPRTGYRELQVRPLGGSEGSSPDLKAAAAAGSARARPGPSSSPDRAA